MSLVCLTPEVQDRGGQLETKHPKGCFVVYELADKQKPGRLLRGNRKAFESD